MIKGFMVIELCDDYEQILALDTGPGMPVGGILRWEDGGPARTIFPNRKMARSAITRTHHYAQAFADDTLPEKGLCKVVPVKMASV